MCGRYYFVDDRCLSSSSSSRCLCCFGLSYLCHPLSSLRISIIIYRRIVGIGRVSNNQRVSLLRLLFNKLRNQASQQNFSYLQTNAAHPPKHILSALFSSSFVYSDDSQGTSCDGLSGRVRVDNVPSITNSSLRHYLICMHAESCPCL